MASMDVRSDLKYLYSWNYYTMRYMGIWPEERKWNRPSSYLVLVPALLMACFVTVPQTINLKLIWGDMNLVVENLSMVNMSVTIALVKTIAFWINGKPLKSLLEGISKDWSTPMPKETRELMKETATLTNTIIVRCTIVCNTTVLVCISHFSLKKDPDNKLFFRAYFPYNADVTPNYQLTVFGQLFAGSFAAICYTAVDTFIAMLILHVCGQLSVLKQEIKKLSMQGEQTFQKNLGKIIRKHEYLNRFAAQVENCFNLMLLLQMLGCTIQLCFQCFHIIMSFGVLSKDQLIIQMNFLVIYTIYVTLHLYLYCYVGERLANEGFEIADEIFSSEWYNLSAENAKLFIIIIRRVKMPLKITAGRFCAFTLELYFQILKTSMGYISVLYAMRNKL